MLNKQLYDNLKKICPSVTVNNENVTPKIKPSRFLGQWDFDDSVSGEAYVLNCPFCKDHKHHLYISSLSFTIPHIGELVYPQAPLLGKCFRRDCLKVFENREQLTEVLSTGNVLSLDIEAEESIWGSDSNDKLADINDWSPDFHKIDESTPVEVLDYLKKRGVRERDIRELHIGYGRCWDHLKEKYLDEKPRIILPLVQFKQVRGVQYRALYDEQFPRYFFDRRTPKAMLLYNYERACRFKVGVMVEGVFDCLAVGANCMAYFGSKPSKAQLQLVEQAGFDMLVWLPDTKISRDPTGKVTLDPPAIARKQVEKWNYQHKFPGGAHVVMLPDKDANDCGMTLVWKTILEQLSGKLTGEQLDVIMREVAMI